MSQYEKTPELQGMPAFVRKFDHEEGQWARSELLLASVGSGAGRRWETDRERGERLIERSGIPKAMRHKTWDDLIDDATFNDGDKAVSVKASLQDYEARLDEMVEGAWGLVLIGPAGWGKSLGAALVAMDAVRGGFWVRFVSYADLVKREVALIALEKEARASDDDDVWSKFRFERYRLDVIKTHCHILVLDDVGKEHRTASGYAEDQLDLVLRSRQTAGKVTIITTNNPPQSWAAYNAAFASYLFEVGDVIEYDSGQDKRQARRRPSRDS